MDIFSTPREVIDPANFKKYWTHLFVSKFEEKTVSQILDKFFCDRCCIIYWTTFVSDMRFVKHFTSPHFQAKNFTLLIAQNFNSIGDKNTKNQ